MLALLLTFSVFVFLMFLGKAVLEILDFRSPILRSWLLAPCVGLATLVLLTLNLNMALPVKLFGSWLTLALSFFIVVVFYWKRPIVPSKQLVPFLGIAFFSLLYSCWPMFLYGFRWVGYMNGDMGTNCLGALRSLHFSFYRIPEFRELTGTDYSQYWWFHYAAGLYRCGADILLAWLASITRLQPIQLSMPVMAATSLAQLFAGASLILTRPANRKLAFLTTTLLAVSPFFILAVILQVVGQVGGITLLLGLCTLCMRPFPPGRAWSVVLKESFLIAWLAAAFCVYYSEALPFAILAIGAFQGYQFYRGKQALHPLAVSVACFAVLFVIVARQYIFSALGVIVYTFFKSVVVQFASRDFDTMLHPSLFASAFGFQLYYGAHDEPWLSITIALGMLLVAACAIYGVRNTLLGRPWAVLLVVMLAVGAQMFFSNAAFGLFKLSMFAQPVLLIPIAAFALRMPGMSRYLVPLSFFALTYSTATIYTRKSTDLLPSNAITLPLMYDYDLTVPSIPQDDAILWDSPNRVGDWVIGAAGIGTDLRWTDDLYRGFATNPILPYSIRALPPKFGLMKNYMPTVERLSSRLALQVREETILGQTLYNFVPGSRDGVTYLGHLTLDPWHSCRDDGNVKRSSPYLTVHKLQDVDNYLSLLSTDKGGPKFRSSGVTSRWETEDDFYRPEESFYAIGRYLLFEVIRPTPGVRLRVALTRGLIGLGRTLLPASATILGDGTQILPFTGNGAANVISQPIQLYWRDGRAYFAVDAGIPGDRFPDVKTGLMKLFNTHIPLDHREVVAFARYIVPVTDQEYRGLVRPRSVASWPGDLLGNPSLEFSGIYEDGWVSDSAYLILGKAVAGEKLLISGTVPGFGSMAKTGNGLKVLLNGKEIYNRGISPGSFQVEYTLEEDAPECKVSLVFRQMDRLPQGDDRPVAAQLSRVSIVEAPRLTGKEFHQ